MIAATNLCSLNCNESIVNQVGREDSGAKKAPRKCKLQLMVQVPQNDLQSTIVLFRIKKRWDLWHRVHGCRDELRQMNLESCIISNGFCWKSFEEKHTSINETVSAWHFIKSKFTVGSHIIVLDALELCHFLGFHLLLWKDNFIIAKSYLFLQRVTVYHFLMVSCSFTSMISLEVSWTFLKWSATLFSEVQIWWKHIDISFLALCAEWLCWDSAVVVLLGKTSPLWIINFERNADG